VAKTSIAEFVRQVQVERKKIVWPTRRETTSILGVFFFGIDSFYGAVVKMLLSMATGGK
jgi:preprotein translocase subunit SecE